MSSLLVDPFYRQHAQTAFERLGGAAHIASIRPTHDASMAEVVARLGGAIVVCPLASSGELERHADGSFTVRVNQAERDCRQQITAGHELGHRFLDFCIGGPINPDDDPLEFLVQEAFCDYFAHQLVGVPECLQGQGTRKE